jgi:hypothetical protein
LDTSDGDGDGSHLGRGEQLGRWCTHHPAARYVPQSLFSVSSG